MKLKHLIEVLVLTQMSNTCKCTTVQHTAFHNPPKSLN